MRRSGYFLGVLLAALLVAPLSAQTPTGIIRGMVRDAATQQPVEGVTVTFGSAATMSRADGRFQINAAPVGTDTLRGRLIGYNAVARVVTVAPGQTVDADLTLSAHAVKLEEIVVVGYGEQRAGNITGAVTNVTSEEFNTGRVITPSELIQNKVAGVQVIENNEPGGGTSIRIRGATSTTASSDPLIVVDGIPLGNGGGGVSIGRDPLNFINSNDIESMTVLRDASAASIYGTNAANGVILITTKKGRGAPKFEYTGTVSSSSVTRLPTMLNAAQFRAAVVAHAPANVPQLGTSNTNWFDLVDRNAIGQEQNFAISGSGNSNTYRISANYLDQDGILEATNTQRVTLGINYSQLLFKDRLNVRLSLRGSRARDQFTPGGVLSNAAQMGPTQPVHDANAPTGFFDWTGGIQSADNPVAILALAKNQGTTLRSVGNVQGAYNLPLDGLTANINMGYDVSRASRVSFDPSVLHAQIKNGNYGNYFRQDPSQLNTAIEPYLNYAIPKPIGPGLLDLTAGYSYSTSHSEFPTTSADSLSTDLLGINAIPAAKTVKSTQFIDESKLISFFGRVNYNINDRYLINASLRRDGSSRFGPDRQWGTFPSLAVAWRISQESFLKNMTSLSDLKLRASWAQTGNQSFSNYLWSSTYTVGDAQSQYWMGNGFVTTIRPSAVDPDIKWEATRSFDLGVDFGFKNQRFSGAIDWYDKKTTDMIFFVPVAAGTVPGDFVTTNIGSMRNRGIEMSLNAQILQGAQGSRGLRWSADFTAAHNSNELLTITPFGGQAQQILTGGIAGGVGQTIQVLKPGSAVNSFFVYKQKYANGKPVEGSYEDLNGDGTINQDDRRPFHDPSPKWILGHSSYLTYGKFDFGFTLRAYLGNYVYNNVASNLGTFSEVTRGSPYNLHSSVLETGFTTQQLFSDFYVEKASFLRMDNLTLGYSFSLRGQSARVFGTIQNAFTITGYSGVDPTAGLNGIDNNLYPRSRTLTGGLSLQF
jgi:iron complex outermembrane receptor protein